MRVLAGILLMILGFVCLFGVIVIPVLPPTQDDVNINNYLQSFLCQPGEKLIRDLYHRSDSRGTSYSMTPYCVNSERQREDVTAKWTLIGVGGFLAPFLTGLLITIVSASAATRRQRASLFQAIPNIYGGTDFAIFNASGNQAKNIGFGDGTIKVNGFEIKMDGLTQEKIDALKSQMQTSAVGGDLTNKLKQIQDAKDNGLISSDEYDRLRQKILDDLG